MIQKDEELIIQREILKKNFKEDVGYLTDLEVSKFFDETIELNSYYINEFNSILSIKGYNKNDSKQ